MRSSKNKRIHTRSDEDCDDAAKRLRMSSSSSLSEISEWKKVVPEQSKIIESFNDLFIDSTKPTIYWFVWIPPSFDCKIPIPKTHNLLWRLEEERLTLTSADITAVTQPFNYSSFPFDIPSSLCFMSNYDSSFRFKPKGHYKTKLVFPDFISEPLSIPKDSRFVIDSFGTVWLFRRQTLYTVTVSISSSSSRTWSLQLTRRFDLEDFNYKGYIEQVMIDPKDRSCVWMVVRIFENNMAAKFSLLRIVLPELSLPRVKLSIFERTKSMQVVFSSMLESETRMQVFFIRTNLLYVSITPLRRQGSVWCVDLTGLKAKIEPVSFLFTNNVIEYDQRSNKVSQFSPSDFNMRSVFPLPCGLVVVVFLMNCQGYENNILVGLWQPNTSRFTILSSSKDISTSLLSDIKYKNVCIRLQESENIIQVCYESSRYEAKTNYFSLQVDYHLFERPLASSTIHFLDSLLVSEVTKIVFDYANPPIEWLMRGYGASTKVLVPKLSHINLYDDVLRHSFISSSSSSSLSSSSSSSSYSCRICQEICNRQLSSFVRCACSYPEPPCILKLLM